MQKHYFIFSFWKTQGKQLFLLFLIAWAGFFQVGFGLHPLKFDLTSYHLPWRFLLGEMLQHGDLPLWNLYQGLGSPLHADPQSGAWYPVAWFFGYFFGYNIFTIAIEFVLHIFLAGWGMYCLTSRFVQNKVAALAAGVAYMLSGFMTGHAAHFTWIISAAWIPFILDAFRETRIRLSILSAVKTAFFTFMLVSGGYPAFSIILAYGLGLIFVYYIFKDIRQRQFRKLFKYSALAGLSLAACLAMSAVILMSVFDVTDSITRGAGVARQAAADLPFSPLSLLSFIFPFASVSNLNEMQILLQTDLSMSNAYFGLLMLAFFLFSLSQPLSNQIKLILVAGLFCLLISMGNYFPFRYWLYDYIPGMKLFRFPALFRLITILSFILLAAKGIHMYFSSASLAHSNKKLKPIVYSLLFISLALSVYGAAHLSLLQIKGLLNLSYTSLKNSGLHEHLFIQGIIQAVLMILVAYILFYRKTSRSLLTLITTLITFDLILALQLNAPYTVYLYHSKALQPVTVKGFPLPPPTPLINRSDTIGKIASFERNLNIWKKIPVSEGYNSFVLKNYSKLINQHKSLFDNSLQNTDIFLAVRLIPVDSADFFEKQEILQPGFLFVEKNCILPPIRKRSEDTIYLEQFTPNHIKAIAQTQEGGMFCLLQNHYKGWKLYVNGNEQPLCVANYSFMCGKLLPGQNHIELKYEPKNIRQAFYVSAFSYLIVVLVLLTSLFRKKSA